ncbi:YpoC family protein [Paraliobacillus ryukyuensis]|uniref:YpoC family protein n=1 Tax=Paraliobacillus ryukyuensis TaxID=200904 RepID=UPI0009A7812B|nr:hypothetical protein [Paraliobacillus ryukyuensis]
MLIDKGKEWIENWKANHQAIADLFQQRRYPEAKEPVQYYTKQLVLVLGWLNDTELIVDNTLSEKLTQLTYAPFNSQERIPFILRQPEQYYCYIQLNELYKETEKIYAKVAILKQKTRSQQ